MIWLPCVVVVVLLCLIMALLAANSRARTVSITGDRLPAYNPDKPGVHSRATGLDSYIAPLDYCEPQWIKQLAQQRGWTLQYEGERLFHFVAKTPLFGFADDVCFEFDRISNQIYLSSTSRIGKSDLNANRKRLEAFRKDLIAALSADQASTDQIDRRPTDQRSGTALGESQ